MLLRRSANSGPPASPPGYFAPMIRRLVWLLDHPRLPLFAALLAVILVLPSLGGGLVADDWFHRAHLDERSTLIPPHRGPLFDMFDFFPRDPAVRAKLLEDGVLPWWFSPNAYGGFFRPVAAATHAFDWLVVGNVPWLHHAHSLVWMFVCVLVVGALFREWLGIGRVAALATLFFALDDAHAWPAAWLANRNALIAMTFGAGAAWANLRARRFSHRWPVLPAVLLALALLSAEAGTATVLLMLALEIGYTEPWRQRIWRWTPLALTSLVWAITWKSLGYGIQGSGLYVDPLRTPLRFLAVAPERLGALSAAAWGNVPVDFWVFLTPPVALPLGIALGAATAAIVWFIGRDTMTTVLGRQAWFVAVLCLAPTVAAFCMERVTTFAVIGVSAFFALVVAPRIESQLRRRDYGILGWHLGVSGVWLLVKSWGVPAFMGQLGAVIDAVPTDAAFSQDQLVIVSGFEVTTVYIPVALEIEGRPRPTAMLVIGPAASGFSVSRPDTHTLMVESPNGMFRHAVERLFRVEPFVVGEQVDNAVGTVRVESVDATGHPTRVSVRFKQDIDSPQYRWLAPDSGVLVPWTPPAIGQTLQVVPLLPLPG